MADGDKTWKEMSLTPSVSSSPLIHINYYRCASSLPLRLDWQHIYHFSDVTPVLIHVALRGGGNKGDTIFSSSLLSLTPFPLFWHIAIISFFFFFSLTLVPFISDFPSVCLKGPDWKALRFKNCVTLMVTFPLHGKAGQRSCKCLIIQFILLFFSRAAGNCTTDCSTVKIW